MWRLDGWECGVEVIQYAPPPSGALVPLGFHKLGLMQPMASPVPLHCCLCPFWTLKPPGVRQYVPYFTMHSWSATGLISAPALMLYQIFPRSMEQAAVLLHPLLPWNDKKGGSPSLPPKGKCASANFQPASYLSVQSLLRSTSCALLPCRCKLFAICWVLGISCTLRDFTNLP